MDYSTSKDIGEVFNALWPHLVETIGAAVDGDPTKIRVLQEAPYSGMQMQSVRSAGNQGLATNSDDAGSSVLPSPKTKRNRNPCHACRLRRQRCIRNPADPDTCERCSQKKLSCGLYSRNIENLAELSTPFSEPVTRGQAIMNSSGVEGGCTLDIDHSFRSAQEAMHLAAVVDNFDFTTMQNLQDYSQSTTGHFGGGPGQANVNAMLNAGSSDGQDIGIWDFPSK